VLALSLNSGSLFDGINPALVDIGLGEDGTRRYPKLCAAGKLPGN
jgi:hypothetical protein